MLKSGSELKTTFQSSGKAYSYYSLFQLDQRSGGKVSRLPYSLRVLLENLLRYEDGGETVSVEDIDAVVNWDPKATPSREIAFRPSRVLLQDFTGVPVVVDLAAMRHAMAKMGGEINKINPLQQLDLVIDHSVQVDEYGSQAAQLINVEKEYERNKERYAFLRWGQKAFDNFSVVPPGTGIVHQVNLEYLAKVAYAAKKNGETFVYPDSLVGTDSHTTMINGLGVLGWGVGGIEAEAAMLGQPISMLVPQVVGFKMTGKLPAGATATDLVLTVTQMLRKKGVVDKFVEYYGDGLSALTLADRATIANMAPEYGATMGFFPVDEKTLEYLRLSGRDAEQVQLVEDYFKTIGLFRLPNSPEPIFSDTLELDLSTVEPSLAGPKRPQDRVPLSKAKAEYRKAVAEMIGDKGFTEERKKNIARWVGEGGGLDPEANPVRHVDDETTREHTGEHPLGPLGKRVKVQKNGSDFHLKHGDVVIAAITSCTNTSNPSVLVAAGLLAKNAAARGLKPKPWVKTSLAPGSKVVTEYLRESGLLPELEKVGFHVVGYGCTTCIGNSGPLPGPISAAIHEGDLVAAAVLSGNRNFEGRVNPDVRANYLASPPLVVAYALAGTIDKDLAREPLGEDQNGKPVYLKDIWPKPEEIQAVERKHVRDDMFRSQYASVFEGDENWRSLPAPQGGKYEWDEASLYVRHPPYFENMPARPAPVQDIKCARVLAKLGDSVTTDHISPAGSIDKGGPAAKYLMDHGVAFDDFNSYGSRRGNHEVMMRGTFANIRLKNQLAPGTEGGWTRHQPSGEQMSIFDAAMKYKAAGVPSIVLAGKEYGTGSSRDWAAKGPALLGVRAAIAQSFERIHRSNLIGMGVLPLQFPKDQSAETLGLTGKEEYSIEGLAAGVTPGMKVKVTVQASDGPAKTFEALARIDTPNEAEYYRHGGILQYVLRQLLAK